MNNVNDKVIQMRDVKKFVGLRVKRSNESYNKNKPEDGDIQMSENNSMDTLFKELKIDLREREERSRREISEREERFEKQMDQYANESSEREKRFREDMREREERIISSLDKIEHRMESHSENMESMKSQNFWGNIALFVGMLAIVITLLIVT